MSSKSTKLQNTDQTAQAWHPDGVPGKDAEGRVTLTFRRFYPHSVEHVWRAITDPEQTRNWLGKLDFEPKTGGQITMILDGSDPVNGTETTGEILECRPPNVLEYWIHALEMKNLRVDHHINRWEVSATEGGSVLEFTHTFAEGERQRNSVACGWHAMLELVEDTIEGHQTNWATHSKARIEELYWHYRNLPRD